MARTLYMAHTCTSVCDWPFTRPRATPAKAIESAVNQVSSAILGRLGIVPPSEGSFSIWLRTNHPDIVAESHDFIGEVRQVTLSDDETPRQFRNRFCNISLNEVTAQTNSLGESLA